MNRIKEREVELLAQKNEVANSKQPRNTRTGLPILTLVPKAKTKEEE